MMKVFGWFRQGDNRSGKAKNNVRVQTDERQTIFLENEFHFPEAAPHLCDYYDSYAGGLHLAEQASGGDYQGADYGTGLGAD